jgi:hypothetical protein
VPYLGASPTVGLVTKLSNIASGFNGSTTTFQLSIPPGGASNYFTPGSTYALFVRLGGVTQNPDVDYTVSGSQITFTTAPASGLTCLIIAIGQAINIGVPNDGSVGQSKLGTITSLPLTGATSGTTTLAPPAVAGNNTITLPASNGSAYQVLRNGATAGTTEFADNIVSGTAKDYNWNGLTTNTVIDFTGIPSWVKRITVMIADVSTNSGNASLLQFGSSGVIQTSNYKSRTSLSGGNTATSTNGIIWGVSGGGAGNTYRGSIVATLVGSNVWVATGMVDVQDGNTQIDFNAGRVTLSGTLDTLRVQAGTAGTEVFDAGTINILYE